VEKEMSDFTLRLVLKGDKLFDLFGPADITKETTAAIVNAANSSLLGGGGVDGAIHRAGGPAILAECKRIVAQIRRLPAGQAVITTGGRLAAKHVIHTVGPVYSGGKEWETEMLASCYRASIQLADEHAIRSLAFPAISTGAFGYPPVEAAKIAVPTALAALEAAQYVAHVRFVMFDHALLRIYSAAVEKLHQSGSISPLKIERAE
jgi:O-acetyl-ADP-ribose deacetylase